MADTAPTTEGTLLELDSRKRITLGRMARNRTRFIATEHPDGSITLTPAVVLSEFEARLLQDPEAMARIDAALRGENIREATEEERALGM